MKNQPPEIALLCAKGVCPGSFFVLHGGPDRFYAVTKSGRIHNIAGERVSFTENDIWEQFEQIERIAREQFEQAALDYRDNRWRQKGQPDSRELEALAIRFCEDYRTFPEEKRWRWACRWEEETILRLAGNAAERLSGKGASSTQRHRLEQSIYREIVLEKALFPGWKKPGRK